MMILQRTSHPGNRTIAYFSMEIGLDAALHTYSGGLGVLAGDTLRSAADMKIPGVAMSLLHRKGYFQQKLDPSGRQIEESADWPVEKYLTELPQRIEVPMENRKVAIRAWEFRIKGVTGYEVPVYFLDTDLPSNSEWDRSLSFSLYGGDPYYRICQEMILGIGGVKMLRSLGYREIEKFHMNEGHSSFLVLELLEEECARKGKKSFELIREALRKKCVFTTHTPVPAGHDKFSHDLVKKALPHVDFSKIMAAFGDDGNLNMTLLAMMFSGYVNAVSQKHGEVSRQMFNNPRIDAITNGVHAQTWTAKSFQELFDRRLPGWREYPIHLRRALDIHRLEVWEAHMEAKTHLVDLINQKKLGRFDINHFTIGFARRVAGYKRADLIFHDLDRLKRIASKAGRFQLVFAGKAHPHDVQSKEIIHRIFQAREALKNSVTVVYLENYDIALAKYLTSGVDLWLNNPEPPLEASGTSGMKAALNGIPNLSTLDGWWIEGHLEGVTGWSIDSGTGTHHRAKEAASLYSKLEEQIIPLFYQSRDRYIDVMLHSIAMNGSYFNTHRMLHEYVVRAYFQASH